MGYREKALRAKGEYCHLCGRTDRIEVHHINADSTNNDLENLVPVCPSCHEQIHTAGSGVEWPPENHRRLELHLDVETEQALRALVRDSEQFTTVREAAEHAVADYARDAGNREPEDEDSPPESAIRGVDTGNHRNAILQILSETGRIESGDFYSEYRTRVANPRSERQFRNYLEDLRAQGLIATEGQTRWKEYFLAE